MSVCEIKSKIIPYNIPKIFIFFLDKSIFNAYINSELYNKVEVTEIKSFCSSDFTNQQILK